MLEPEGPKYPYLGTGVAKFRRKSLASIYDLSREERIAYADAIEKAIRAKHRAMHTKPTPSMTPNWYHPPTIARLLRYENPIPMQGDPDWRSGNQREDKWQRREMAVYAQAMELKHGRK